jgi:hypothetical protein
VNIIEPNFNFNSALSVLYQIKKLNNANNQILIRLWAGFTTILGESCGQKCFIGLSLGAILV